MRKTAFPPIVPEKNKVAGLSYAFAEKGLELPVIDLAHPAFGLDPLKASALEPAELERLMAEALEDLRKRERMPAFAQALMARLLGRGSILAREIVASRGSYLSGLGTYLVKLGPENLGSGFASELDRKIASALPCLNARLRLRDSVRLLSESLLAPLEAGPGRPLVLIAIAGGPASDSLNAFMAIRRQRPALLEGRKLRVYVLDCDGAGPAFGSASLSALLAEGGALEGLDAAMIRVAYDWNDASTLGAVARDAADAGAITAASSEGGLFEYGDDAAIAANLEALAGGPAGISVVGTLSRDDGPARILNEASGASIRIRIRGSGEFEALLRSGGWAIGREVDTPLSRVFALNRA
jgi:hypothetical protein